MLIPRRTLTDFTSPKRGPQYISQLFQTIMAHQISRGTYAQLHRYHPNIIHTAPFQTLKRSQAKAKCITSFSIRETYLNIICQISDKKIGIILQTKTATPIFKNVHLAQNSST